MTQLRALVALPEDPGPVSSTQGSSRTLLTTLPGDRTPSSDQVCACVTESNETARIVQ